MNTSFFTLAGKADKRFRRDEVMELVWLGATETAASALTSDICNNQNKYHLKG